MGLFGIIPLSKFTWFLFYMCLFNVSGSWQNMLIFVTRNEWVKNAF